MESQNQQNNKNLMMRIINSPISIIIVLILFSVLLMIYSRYLVKSTNLYTFSGYKDKFYFMGGSIFIGRDLNYFNDSKVDYSGEDMELYDFELGYYIKDEDVYKEISITEGYEVGEDKEKIGASLKELLAKTTFSFSEVHKEALFLSKDNIELIKNLVFRINGKNKKGESIEIEIPMDVEKITK